MNYHNVSGKKGWDWILYYWKIIFSRDRSVWKKFIVTPYFILFLRLIIKQILQLMLPLEVIFITNF